MSEEYDFRFDLLHVHPSPTEDLYDKKIQPVVEAALGGFNGTVFACVLKQNAYLPSC
jgi:centromeric protein E